LYPGNDAPTTSTPSSVKSLFNPATVSAVTAANARPRLIMIPQLIETPSCERNSTPLLNCY
ncbi:hypothetical protein, partial [Mycobacteroides abscessus]|uniref:hypothetical protein n=1 Tax=Mycobacteroides abscessus TaxID=36809 RepID=UPI001C255FD3